MSAFQRRKDLPRFRIESDGLLGHTRIFDPQGNDISRYVRGVKWDLNGALAQVTLSLVPTLVDVVVSQRGDEAQEHASRLVDGPATETHDGVRGVIPTCSESAETADCSAEQRAPGLLQRMAMYRTGGN